MNERIKELAEQTDKWFEEDGHSYSRPAWNKKFAELIIKECIQVLLDRKYDNPYDSGTMLVNQGLQTGVEILSAKFGVKE